MNYEQQIEQLGVLLIRELSEVERAQARRELRRMFGGNAPTYKVDDIRAITVRLPGTMEYQTHMINVNVLRELGLPEAYGDVNDIAEIAKEVEAYGGCGRN